MYFDPVHLPVPPFDAPQSLVSSPPLQVTTAVFDVCGKDGCQVQKLSFPRAPPHLTSSSIFFVPSSVMFPEPLIPWEWGRGRS